MPMIRYVAEMTAWDGTVDRYYIPYELIDDLVSAVEGQYLFINNKDNVTIDGSKYVHINVYEINEEVKDVTKSNQRK